jgi:hypothetical protein
MRLKATFRLILVALTVAVISVPAVYASGGRIPIRVTALSRPRL